MEELDVIMLQETKMEKCDKILVSSLWMARNREWTE